VANSSLQIPKAHIIMALCLPLAVLLGYCLAEPLDSGSLAILVFVIVVLSVPLMIRWHHAVLVLSWQSFITPIFFPGHAPLWLVISAVSLLIAILNRATNPKATFHIEPSVTWAILILTAVVVITGYFTGGFGLRSFGAAHQGGSKYFLFIGAVIGYFAISSQPIPPQKAGLYMALFFLSTVTALVSNLVYLAGPGFYFLYAIFPPGFAQEQASASLAESGMARIGALSWTGPAVFLWLLARFGIRGLFDVGRPWRLALFAITVAAGVCGGFRWVLVMFVLTFVILFFLEELHRTRYLALFLGSFALMAVLLVPFVNKLPLAAQRTLSFLPLNIDQVSRDSAIASSEWRIQMWKAALPEIPKYLWKGRGYSHEAQEIEYASNVAFRRFEDPWSGALMMGDYHNGPLSVIIPFGIWGVIAFLAFIYVAIKVLYRHYSQGDPALRRINALLLASFLARTILFFFVFGTIYSDMFLFTGILGLSVALNAPKPVTETEEDPTLAELESGLNEA
jgi:hypothetical protein